MHRFFNGNEQQCQQDSTGTHKRKIASCDENNDDRQINSTNKNGNEKDNGNNVRSFKRRKLNHQFDTSISSTIGTESSHNTCTDELPYSDPRFDVRTLHGRTCFYKFFYSRFDELYDCLVSIAFIGPKQLGDDGDDATNRRKDIIIYNKTLQKTKYSTVQGLQYMILKYMKIMKYIHRNIMPILHQTNQEKALCKKTYHLIQMSRRLSSHITNDSVVQDDE